MMPYYLRRMVRRGGYFKHFVQRFGFVQKVCHKEYKSVIWIQAVSVGEVEAIRPLIEELARKDGIGIYLTTTTSTGFLRANLLYGKLVAGIAYFPINFFIFSKIAWNRIKPSVVVLMESELWPEHIFEANKRKVPILLINGRCSDRSFARYKRVKFVTKWLFEKIDNILASSELDSNRFVELGANKNKVTITGNLKFDCFNEEYVLQQNDILSIKQSIGADWQNAKILIGASTWPGEEELLLEFYLNNKEKIENLKLILVPRHAERRDEIEKVLQNVKYKFRSKNDATSSPADVYVVDTTGELKNFIQLSNVVFVGKSMLKNVGGQTPIEAAALSKPIVYGPNMQNFSQICKSLESSNAAIRVNTKFELFNSLEQLLSSDSRQTTLASAAKTWHSKNIGASIKTLNILVKYIKIDANL